MNSAFSLTFDELKYLIETKKITSVEDLLLVLPEAERSRYALVFKSRSLQESSEQNPRIVVYGKKGEFVFTFNGKANQKGFDTLETMQFNDKNNEFEFREISFPSSMDKQKTVHFSKKNPAVCLQCHGNPARPIWDTHPTWPGVYGQKYFMQLDTQEKKGLEAFLTNYINNPRYSKLSHVDAFSDPETFNPSARTRYSVESKEPANAELSRLLTTLNLQVIVNEIKSTVDFSKYQYILLASLNKNCSSLENFFPKELQQSFFEQYEFFAKLSDSKNQEQEKLKKIRLLSNEIETSSLPQSQMESLIFFRFIVEKGLKISTKEWTLALEKGTYDFTAPQNVAEELSKLLLSVVSKQENSILQLSYSNSFGSDEKYCRYLKKKSILAFGGRVDQLEGSIETSEVKLPNLRPILVEQCAKCHQGVIASNLHFDAPNELAKLLHSKNYPRGTLLEEILFRLSPRAGTERMPRGINISPETRRELEQYFQSLAQ